MADQPVPDETEAQDKPDRAIEPVTLSEEDIRWLKEQRQIRAKIEPEPEPDQIISLESMKVTQVKIEEPGPEPEPEPVKKQTRRKPQAKTIRVFKLR